MGCESVLCLLFLGVVVFVLIVVMTSRPRVPSQPVGLSRRRVICVRCGESFFRHERWCPQCKLDSRGEVANQLLDLEATARCIQSFYATQALDTATCDAIYRCIEAHQQVLMHTDDDGKHSEMLMRLEKALGQPLPPGEVALRKNIIAWYRAVPEGNLKALSEPALTQLARLVASVGLTSRALVLFEQLLRAYPQSPQLGSLGEEAGKLALANRDWDRACWFLERAANYPTAAQRRAALLELLEHARARRPLPESLPPRPLDLPTIPVAPLPAENTPAVAAPFADELPTVTLAEAAPTAPTAPAWPRVEARDDADLELLEKSARQEMAAPTPVEIVPPALLPPPAVSPPPLDFRDEDAPRSKRARKPERGGERRPVVAAQPQRHTWAEWVLVFMEQRNILWGELVGGLLIVGCSVALVISLWRTLEELPFFPFLILSAVTSGLYGAGFYTFSHWKLESTSRGLLIIATLLVPLDFLTLAGLSSLSELGPLESATAVAALAWFAFLTQGASRVLIAGPFAPGPPIAWTLTVALSLTSVMQLLAPTVLPGGEQAPLLLHGLGLGTTLPALGCLLPLLARSRGLSWNADRLVGLSFYLGVASFAVGLTLGFLAFCVGGDGQLADHFAPSLLLAGLPLLWAGTTMHVRVLDRELAGWRAAGTGLLLAGVLVMGVAFALAVPTPWLRLLVGVGNLACLSALAWHFRAPLLHLPSQLLLLALCAYGDQAGDWYLHPSLNLGVQLVGLNLLQVAIAEGLNRLGRAADAWCYIAGGAASSVLAVAMVAGEAWGQPGTASLALGTLAATWLTVNLRYRQPLLSYLTAIGGMLAVYLAVHYLDPRLSPTRRSMFAVLTQSTLCLALSLAARRAANDSLELSYVRPLLFVSKLWTIAAAILGITMILEHDARGSAQMYGWVAVLTLAMAWLDRSPRLFALFQASLSLSVFCAMLRWWARGDPEVLHPRSLDFAFLGILALGLLWERLRLALRHTKDELLREWLMPPWTPCDRLLLAAVAATHTVLGLGVLQSGVVAEFGLGFNPFSHWNLNGFPVIEQGVLLLLALIFFSQLQLGVPRWPWVGLALVLILLPAHLATRLYQPDLAVASSFRWMAAVAYASGSALLWERGRLKERGPALSAEALRLQLLAGTVLPAAVLTAAAALFKLDGTPLAGPMPGTFFAQLGHLSLLGPMAVVSLTLAGHGLVERRGGFWFAGGVLMTLSVTVVYAVATLTPDQAPTAPEVVRLLQVAGAVAALWAMTWAAVARALRQPTLAQTPWLHAQAYLAAACLAAILVVAFHQIILVVADPAWLEEAGTWNGTLVFVLVLGAITLAQTGGGRRIPLHLVGSASLAFVVLLACILERLVDADPALVVMAASAALALAWSLGPLVLRRPQVQRWIEAPSDHLTPVGYTAIAAVVGASFSVAALWRPEWYLLAAASMMLISLAMLALACLEPQDLWGWLSHLAFVLAGFYWTQEMFAGIGPAVPEGVQILLAVYGMFTLLWLYVTRRGWAKEQQWSQAARVALGALVPLVLGLVALLEYLDAWVPGLRRPVDTTLLAQIALAPGLAAIVLNFLAVVWYTVRLRPAYAIHPVMAGGLLLGLYAAGAALYVVPTHAALQATLLVSWMALALLIVLGSWHSDLHGHFGPRLLSEAQRRALADALRLGLPTQPTRLWTSVVGTAVLLLAAWTAYCQPGEWHGPVLSAAGGVLLFGMLALWARETLFVLGSGAAVVLLANFLYAIWYSQLLDQQGAFPRSITASAACWTQVLGLAAAALGWEYVDVLLRRRREPGRFIARFVYGALFLAQRLTAIFVGTATALSLGQMRPEMPMPLAWAAWAAVLGGTVATLGDPRGLALARTSLFIQAVLGLGLLLFSLDLAEQEWLVAAAGLLAALVLISQAGLRLAFFRPSLLLRLHLPTLTDKHATTYLHTLCWYALLALGLTTAGVLMGELLELRAASLGATLLIGASLAIAAPLWRNLALAGGSPARPGEASRTSGWVLGFGLAFIYAPVALPALALNVWNFSEPGKEVVFVLLPIIIALTVTSCAALAFHSKQTVPPHSKQTAPEGGWIGLLPPHLGQFFAAFVALSQFGWVWIAPESPSATLQRHAILLAAYAASLAALRWAPLLRAAQSWREARQHILPVLVGFTGMVAVLLLLHEAAVYDSAVRSTGLPLPLRLLVAAALVGLAALGFLEAIHPLHAEAASDKVRSRWVYAAEAMLAGLLLHLRLHTPEWLAVIVHEHWPLLGMALALALVLAAEISRRRGLSPLVEPLSLSGLVLGHVPVLAFQTTLVPQPYSPLQHALCWLLLGALYGWVAALRRSGNLAMLGALAVNFSAWVMLAQHPDLALSTHPQLWFIPVGVILLGTEAINRARLTWATSLALRYLGLLTIYVSSTFDLFLAGLGNSLVLPMVLAALSILGIFLGIALRTRAFMVAGFYFLVLVLLTQIWHAAVDRGQTWVWWASGIVLGTIILTTFALFEKHRPEFLKMVEEVKSWR